MAWDQQELAFGVLFEFAERQARAFDVVARVEVIRSGRIEAARLAVKECIARKQARECELLAASRRRASANYYARLKADPLRWAIHTTRLRNRTLGRSAP